MCSGLAFATVRESLRLYFNDHRAGNYCLHVEDIRPAQEPRSAVVVGERVGLVRGAKDSI
jgi:hypothetical protein